MAGYLYLRSVLDVESKFYVSGRQNQRADQDRQE